MSLGLSRSDDIRDAHEFQQSLTLLVVLPRDTDGPPGELLNILRGTRLLSLLERLLRFGLALEAAGQLAGLELRRRAVEYVERFYAILDHAKSTVEHTHDVGGGGTVFVHQLLTVGTNGDHEAVDTHGCINGHLSTELIFNVALLDRIGGFIFDYLE